MAIPSFKINQDIILDERTYGNKKIYRYISDSFSTKNIPDIAKTLNFNIVPNDKYGRYKWAYIMNRRDDTEELYCPFCKNYTVDPDGHKIKKSIDYSYYVLFLLHCDHCDVYHSNENIKRLKFEPNLVDLKTAFYEDPEKLVLQEYRYFIEPIANNKTGYRGFKKTTYAERTVLSYKNKQIYYLPKTKVNENTGKREILSPFLSGLYSIGDQRNFYLYDYLVKKNKIPSNSRNDFELTAYVLFGEINLVTIWKSKMLMVLKRQPRSYAKPIRDIAFKNHETIEAFISEVIQYFGGDVNSVPLFLIPKQEYKKLDSSLYFSIQDEERYTYGSCIVAQIKFFVYLLFLKRANHNTAKSVIEMLSNEKISLFGENCFSAIYADHHFESFFYAIRQYFRIFKKPEQFIGVLKSFALEDILGQKKETIKFLTDFLFSLQINGDKNFGAYKIKTNSVKNYEELKESVQLIKEEYKKQGGFIFEF